MKRRGSVLAEHGLKGAFPGGDLSRLGSSWQLGYEAVNVEEKRRDVGLLLAREGWICDLPHSCLAQRSLFGFGQRLCPGPELETPTGTS